MAAKLCYSPSDVEGLRGIAVLLVVLFHAGVAGFGGGFVGVDVFFVLSGFLITYPFCRARMQDPEAWYVPGYATRRALKIFPPFYLIIVLLAAFYLRSRRLSFLQYLAWGLLIVLAPMLGPFLAIVFRPGQARN